VQKCCRSFAAFYVKNERDRRKATVEILIPDLLRCSLRPFYGSFYGAPQKHLIGCRCSRCVLFRSRVVPVSADCRARSTYDVGSDWRGASSKIALDIPRENNLDPVRDRPYAFDLHRSYLRAFSDYQRTSQRPYRLRERRWVSLWRGVPIIRGLSAACSQRSFLLPVLNSTVFSSRPSRDRWRGSQRVMFPERNGNAVCPYPQAIAILGSRHPFTSIDDDENFYLSCTITTAEKGEQIPQVRMTKANNFGLWPQNVRTANVLLCVRMRN
jgi:hypothetical protein